MLPHGESISRPAEPKRTPMPSAKARTPADLSRRAVDGGAGIRRWNSAEGSGKGDAAPSDASRRRSPGKTCDQGETRDPPVGPLAARLPAITVSWTKNVPVPGFLDTF